MSKKFFVSCLVAILTVTLLGTSAIAQIPATNVSVTSVEALPMFQAAKFDAHYRVPRDVTIEQMLVDLQVIKPDTTPAQIQGLVQQYKNEFIERNPTTPNPKKLQKLLEKERNGKFGPMADEVVQPQIMSLAVPVEFPNSDTFDWCGESVTTTGPLHNEIPAPGPRDNNTVWYEDATPELYSELYFGVGPNAGVIVDHPNLGLVDLRGLRSKR